VEILNVKKRTSHDQPRGRYNFWICNSEAGTVGASSRTKAGAAEANIADICGSAMQISYIYIFIYNNI
jgi:hypothetical protein